MSEAFPPSSAFTSVEKLCSRLARAESASGVLPVVSMLPAATAPLVAAAALETALEPQPESAALAESVSPVVFPPA